MGDHRKTKSLLSPWQTQQWPISGVSNSGDNTRANHGPVVYVMRGIETRGKDVMHLPA